METFKTVREAFFEQYLEAILDCYHWHNLYKFPLFDKSVLFTENCINTIKSDCKKFLDENGELIKLACYHHKYDYGCAGYDFCGSRLRASRGFLYRSPEIGTFGTQLHNVCRKSFDYQEFDINNDGKIDIIKE